MLDGNRHLSDLIRGLLCWMTICCAATIVAQPPPFPPGVTLLEESPGKELMPSSLEVYSLAVDWTHPLLRVRLELGLQPGDEVPMRWTEVARDAFKVQLVEPVLVEDAWRLALDAELPGPKPDARRGKIAIDPQDAPAASTGFDWPDQVRIGGVVGWAAHGARALRAINAPPPVIDGSARVNVRWLGHPSEWTDRPPDFNLDSSWMISVFDSLSGRGEFHQLINRSGRPVPPKDLHDWVLAAWPERHVWLAIHSVGEQVMAGIGDWRLGEGEVSRAPTSGKIERLGAVLVLESVKPGEPVDWARLAPVSFSASPTMPDHEPEKVITGLLWPSPLRPIAWASSNEGKDIEIAPYIELNFQEAQTINRVRIMHASAAGWSRHFDPLEFQLRLVSKDAPIMPEPIVIKTISDSDTVVELAESQIISVVRIEFTKPSGMDHPRSPARVAALQAWGPWDGVTGLDEEN